MSRRDIDNSLDVLCHSKMSSRRIDNDNPSATKKNRREEANPSLEDVDHMAPLPKSKRKKKNRQEDANIDPVDDADSSQKVVNLSAAELSMEDIIREDADSRGDYNGRDYSSTKQLAKQATSKKVENHLWEVNKMLCDIINNDLREAKVALLVIKNRLQDLLGDIKTVPL